MNNNSVESIGVNMALRAANFTPDTTRPELLEFEFDRIPGSLTLTFSEVIYTDTFEYTPICDHTVYHVCVHKHTNFFNPIHPIPPRVNTLKNLLKHIKSSLCVYKTHHLLA